MTYVLRIVFPKVLEHHTGDYLAYYINNYIITDMVMVVIKFRVVCRSFINTVEGYKLKINKYEKRNANHNEHLDTF